MLSEANGLRIRGEVVLGSSQMTLGESKVLYTQSQRITHTHIHTRNLKSPGNPVNLPCISLDPRTFLLRGDSADHCTTVSPLIFIVFYKKIRQFQRMQLTHLWTSSCFFSRVNITSRSLNSAVFCVSERTVCAARMWPSVTDENCPHTKRLTWQQTKTGNKTYQPATFHAHIHTHML